MAAAAFDLCAVMAMMCGCQVFDVFSLMVECMA
jgi:hypothetical protein